MTIARQLLIDGKEAGALDGRTTEPFGGMGDSGYGRFGGRAGVESFTDLRWITLQQGHRPFPF